MDVAKLDPMQNKYFMGGLFIWDVSGVEKGKHVSDIPSLVISCWKKTHKTKTTEDLIWDLTLMLEWCHSP